MAWRFYRLGLHAHWFAPRPGAGQAFDVGQRHIECGGHRGDIMSGLRQQVAALQAAFSPVANASGSALAGRIPSSCMRRNPAASSPS